MSKVGSMLDKFDGSEQVEMMQIVGMLADPLTRKIMAKLASPQSPISADDIPADKLESDRISVISRLRKLESVGITSSTKMISKKGFCKQYSISPSGRNLVDLCMKKESKMFA